MNMRITPLPITNRSLNSLKLICQIHLNISTPMKRAIKAMAIYKSVIFYFLRFFHRKTLTTLKTEFRVVGYFVVAFGTKHIRSPFFVISRESRFLQSFLTTTTSAYLHHSDPSRSALHPCTDHKNIAPGKTLLFPDFS